MSTPLESVLTETPGGGGYSADRRIDAPKESCTLVRYHSKARQMPKPKRPTAESKASVTSETFRFFRDLSRNNRTEWMESNRDRYKQCVVQPLRALCEELAPALLKLDARFETSGRTGANLSRINRDIRFAKDKTPYRTGMYVKFSAPFSGEGETGQLYVGISAKTVTSGFRIYSGSKRKESALAQIADARVEANPRWLAQQKKRLRRRYESYWYSTEKGEWKQHDGWPAAEDWKKLQAWIVRRELGTGAAPRKTFCRELVEIFRDLHPLLRFTSLRN
jgi:uncharacterized protein (TIGR02453 family)